MANSNSTFFRSEPMSLIQLYIPADTAQATVHELGELGRVQFRDLNPTVTAFQRRHVLQIRRMDEMDRRIRFLTQQAEKANLEVPPASVAARAGGAAGVAAANHARRQQEIDELDALLAETEQRIVSMNASQLTFNKKMLELTEMAHVLRETASFFTEAEAHAADLGAAAAANDDGDGALLADAEAGHSGGGANTGTHLGFVAGVLPRTRLPAVERILWRALRGNMFLRSVDIAEPIVDPATDEPVHKCVIAIFAHGRESLDKIRRLSESLGATLYPVDPAAAKRRADAEAVRGRIEDLTAVLYNTTTTRRHELGKVADRVAAWGVLVAKEKRVYAALNLFAADGPGAKTLIAEAWCPTAAIPAVQHALVVAKEAARAVAPSVLSVMRTHDAPPTYHMRNKVTAGFQELIDAYGIARYREVNPGLFTVITFPFLFAVMFGDVGHGLIVTAVGLWMCIKEDSLRVATRGSESYGMLFGGRYMILLMGIFSVFTGLIYNDMFSKALSIFSSGWDWQHAHADPDGAVIPKQLGVYPIGIDYVWQFAENKLLFTNSYKMKMSIVLGVLHMTFATFLSLFNHLHFGKKINIYTMFIPQVLFMQSIFGYLVVCIIYKWSTDWSQPGMNSPPGLLNMLIFMFLSPGKVKKAEELYPGQATVQQILLLLALICVPWMLVLKPYLLKRAHDRTTALGYGALGLAGAAHNHDDDDEGDHAAFAAGSGSAVASSSSAAVAASAAVGATDPHAAATGGGGGGHAEDGPFDFGAIAIDQTIHTIEYCLSCISNTASYLRLWALSLAHSQLSEVLWDMTIGGVFSSTNYGLQPIMLVVIFPFWLGASVGILIGMEGLSAFLHALRLHWVEFNSKFYEGTGHKFEPFSFAELLE
ncbi:V-type ATPase, V0 complex, 116kDa subunit family [Blastocladiella britannica]|nr:V-type ATPase, V0 complex, 116kDa subunit family [Blastocladiella britannica]